MATVALIWHATLPPTPYALVALDATNLPYSLAPGQPFSFTFSVTNQLVQNELFYSQASWDNVTPLGPVSQFQVDAGATVSKQIQSVAPRQDGIAKVYVSVWSTPPSRDYLLYFPVNVSG
jgi:hypothetical protein